MQLGNGDSCQGPDDDPLVTAAAFELVQVLGRKGIVPKEIHISFVGGDTEPASELINIELPTLTDSMETEPEFPGLQGVFALFIDEEALGD